MGRKQKMTVLDHSGAIFILHVIFITLIGFYKIEHFNQYAIEGRKVSKTNKLLHFQKQ